MVTTTAEIQFGMIVGGPETGALESLSELGDGRAASVYLVRDTRTGKLYAEKVFQTKQGLAQLARDLVYRICFQAPPPYRTNEYAIQAAMFRRKVLRDLTEFWFGSPRVADAYYTRWCEKAQAYVLGTEYIKGYGPLPGKVNRFYLRQLIHNYPLRLLKAVTFSSFKRMQGPAWEIEEAAQWLDELKRNFHNAGFMGTEWQVDKVLSVPTSNLLKDEERNWILVDVESGMPALTLPRYLWQAIKHGSIPLFDDLDFNRLNEYLKMNHREMEYRLGKNRVHRLYLNVERLEYYSNSWKESEPAIFRHRSRLITDKQLRSSIKKGSIACWQVKGQISSEKAYELQSSDLRYVSYLALRTVGDMYSGLCKIARSIKALISCVHWLGRSLRLLYSAFFCDSYLKQLAGPYMVDNVDSWQKSGRLTPREAEKLRQESQLPASAEYVNGMVAHMGLQLLDPPLIGDAVIVSLAVFLGSPEILATLLLSPALRTGYTLSRMWKNRGRGISYRYALAVGALPKVGVFAYGVQMYSVQPDLSTFLMRCQTSKIGSKWPLIGGKDSRMEHLCIKAVDLLASFRFELAGVYSKVSNFMKSALKPIAVNTKAKSRTKGSDLGSDTRPG